MNNTADEPIKSYKSRLKNRIQLTSTSVSTKDEKQAGTIQLSKHVVYKVCPKLQILYRNVEMADKTKTICPKLKICQRRQITQIDFLVFQNSSDKGVI